MEVVTAAPPTGNGVPPFHDHDVREWSRIDTLTGALERARIETDHWATSTVNSSHKYGKVVDCLSRTDPDGGLQHAARRQLEVFHSQVPGGRLQVVKTHAVSKWTSSNGKISDQNGVKDFENLQLSLNSLDLSSQKSKASILRSVSRRPPTRQRPKEPPPHDFDPSDPLGNAHRTAATNLHRVSRLCHQIHESAVRQAFGRRSPRPKLAERQSTVEITEIDNEKDSHHPKLIRTKSSSSEDINLLTDKDTNNKSVEDLEDLEQLQNWRRTSKIRRSLQFPKSNANSLTPSKPIDLPESSVSVRRIKEELEKGRRLNTALRNNSVDLDALDQILQSISSSSSDKASDDVELETSPRSKQKRNSFVTVESIQEVKGRLRRTSSPSCDIYKVNGKNDDTDDGIVTEDVNSSDSKMSLEDKSRVRSYVYGMENQLEKKPGLGTGSLESRVKLVNGNGTTKTEDWYNRRKSYGFEKVHSHEENQRSISLRSKKLVESSTDSGICRSTETVMKRNGYNDEISDSSDLDQKLGFSDSIVNRGIQTGQVKKLMNTFNQIEKISTSKSNRDTWSKYTKAEEDWSNLNQELKSTTIHIPIVKNNNVVDLTWNDEPEKEIKRHSIAVDESKYVKNNNNETKFRRTSLALNDQFIKQDDDENNINRKTKKVEFCKTEVHFAAESGKVNIVATDEKPPPTQNFRRRRRNSGPTLEDFNVNGLPVLHFGDSTDEKSLFGTTENTTNSSIYENVIPKPLVNVGLVTVNTTNNFGNEITEEETKNLTENEIKGILKNKPIKPKPYHLGETIPFNDCVSDDDNKWGVKLRHVEKPDIPIWKSTVTVHNYYDNRTMNSGNEQPQPEFQKLLHNLRPTKRPEYTNEGENRYFESERSEEKYKNEVMKGYSTKINFGEGQATIVQNDRHPTWPKGENLTKDFEKPVETLPAPQPIAKSAIKSSRSPTTSKRSSPLNNQELKPSEKLSSPFLVGQNANYKAVPNIRDSSVTNLKTAIDKKLHSKHSSDGMVLRQPKKSEMTYFGVNVSPKPAKKVSQAVIRKEERLRGKSPSPVQPKKTNDSASSPIYENLKYNKYSGREIDSSILEELTKAADQILQAVNGYTDEDENLTHKKPLETISETKSWKLEASTAKTSASTAKTKLKNTSSTSSIDSVSRQKLAVEKATSRNVTEKQKIKTEKTESSSSRATTKARRLQRASSREALLQSHGSSSEDLPAKAEVPVRKPRLVKKTKVTQVSMTNGLEMKKSPNSSSRRNKREESTNSDERILGSLPEIRHKTAVSTIRSTAEKTARDSRIRQKSDNARKKTVQKREATTRVLNSSSSRLTDKDSTSRPVTANKETVMQHRISTANIKKCSRSEGLRH